MNPYVLNNKLIVIASHNEGKIKEFKSLFSKYNVKLLKSSQLKIKEVDETGKSFEENAILKALSIPSDQISLSDDSGLCVDALNGRPGIFSARFSNDCGGWDKAMREIYKQISNLKKPFYTAKFVSVLALKIKEQRIKLFRGEISGTITWPPRGHNGFGYDPFFIPNGYKETFGEMQHKDKILRDHRYKAFLKLSKEHLVGN